MQPTSRMAGYLLFCVKIRGYLPLICQLGGRPQLGWILAHDKVRNGARAFRARSDAGNASVGSREVTLPPRADGGAAAAFDKRPRFSSSSFEGFLQFREAVAVAAHEP